MVGVGLGGLTVIIMQVSVQIGLNWYWTGTELGSRISMKSKSLSFEGFF